VTVRWWQATGFHSPPKTIKPESREVSHDADKGIKVRVGGESQNQGNFRHKLLKQPLSLEENSFLILETNFGKQSLLLTLNPLRCDPDSAKH